jgi:hypothetical protein
MEVAGAAEIRGRPVVGVVEPRSRSPVVQLGRARSATLAALSSRLDDRDIVSETVERQLAHGEANAQRLATTAEEAPVYLVAADAKRDEDVC